MTGALDWAGTLPADWWPIICTGGSPHHPVELLGVLTLNRDEDPFHPGESIGCTIRRRAVEGGGCFIKLTSAVPGNFEFTSGTITAAILIDSLGSVEVSCPSCSKVSRVKRGDFLRFLVACVSGLRTLDVAMLV